MFTLRRRTKRLLGSGESGASAVEYALVVALIAGVIIAVVAVLGTKTGGVVQSFCASLAAATGSGGC